MKSIKIFFLFTTLSVCPLMKIFASSADYHNIGVSTTVLVSSTSWTAIPSTGNIAPTAGIQYLHSSGNIASGDFYLYGIRGN